MHIGMEESNYAKFKFVQEGINFFLSSPQAATHHFEVECDSFNAINWTRDHNKVPWRMKFISNAIESYLRNNVGISFIHILWQANLVADGLTKIGVLRACNFKAYFDMGNTPRLNYSQLVSTISNSVCISYVMHQRQEQLLAIGLN